MTDGSLSALLESWRSGQLALPDLEQRLAARFSPTASIEQVLLDLDRVRRCGYPEVVYGAGKTIEQLIQIFRTQRAADQPSLATRCTPEQAEAVCAVIDGAVYQPVARTLRWGALPQQPTAKIVVATAGATDRPVAEEAAETARWMGCQVELLQDVGVAGPWRLIEHRGVFREARAVVVVAGMEGALPSIAAGWVNCPVIAVPTSVGYGANLQGMAALLSMLSSCAANVAVVNIDAGFKAGYLAGMIARGPRTTPEDGLS